ncbi:hypothetical protein [Nitrospira sp. Nam80]|jgi:hypothetical protein
MLPVLSAWVFLLLDYGRVESACGSSVDGSREDRLCRGFGLPDAHLLPCQSAASLGALSKAEAKKEPSAKHDKTKEEQGVS